MDWNCYKNVYACEWVCTCKPAWCKHTQKQEEFPTHCWETFCHLGKDHRHKRKYWFMKETCHYLHQGHAVDFADAHIKGNDRRSRKLLFSFEVFHKMVEEGFSGRRRKKTFENYVKFRKNAGEQKKKHQNRVWLGTLKGECPQTVCGKLCLFWCWCDRAGLVEQGQE